MQRIFVTNDNVTLDCTVSCVAGNYEIPANGSLDFAIDSMELPFVGAVLDGFDGIGAGNWYAYTAHDGILEITGASGNINNLDPGGADVIFVGLAALSNATITGIAKGRHLRRIRVVNAGGGLLLGTANESEASDAANRIQNARSAAATGEFDLIYRAGSVNRWFALPAI